MIITVPNALDTRICDDVIVLGRYAKHSDIPGRQVYRFDVIDEQENETFEAVAGIIRDTTAQHGLLTPYRWIMLMRYESGQGLIHRHRDTYGPTREYEASTFSTLIYLNTVHNGGETVFFFDDEELVVKPVAGTLLIIPGDVEHEARKAIGQDKYVLLSRHN